MTNPFDWKAQPSKLAKEFNRRHVPGSDGKPARNPNPLPATFHVFMKAVPNAKR